MKIHYVLSISITLLFLNVSFSQNTYDIIFPGKDKDEKCQTCIQIFNNKPESVEFSIVREENDLYFQVNNYDWFNTLFYGANDGIAVDIVLKSKYDCKLKTIENKQIRGFLLKPLYSRELKAKIKLNDDNVYQIKIGEIPKNLQNEDLEYNILFLSNRNLCRYYVIYDLKSYTWDLLDMGMYMDELTYNPKQIQAIGEESYVTQNKKLKFIIPFEKNKATYSQEDIKPIYDSLRLTDFNIKAINIVAYSSIEGITKRNLELQELRAIAVSDALQKFQKPTIQTEVSSSENWVEFFNDIDGTEYSNLKGLSKNDIRNKIAGKLSKEMEPIFEKHRKAVLELELEKKDKYNTEDVNNLLVKFNALIADKNIEESKEIYEKAKDIQNSIFEKLKGNPDAPEFIDKMEVPRRLRFIEILINNSAYKYMADYRYASLVFNDLLELEKMAPENAAVKYNIIAVKLKLWLFNTVEIDQTNLTSEINALKKYGISDDLISRMLVNFQIVIAGKFIEQGDYSSKDNAVEYVNNNYKKFDLSNNDYLNLAQFFNDYSEVEMAVALLEDKAKSIDVDEDLLFYYLNFTLIDRGLTEKKSYRTVMLNAINLNKERFCKLFNSVEKGGVTFQLLADEYLRETYCENCND